MNWIIAFFIVGAMGAFCLLAFCVVVYVGFCEARDDERMEDK